ncbi:hypothetical protein [Streptomyces sp. NPDC001809]
MEYYEQHDAILTPLIVGAIGYFGAKAQANGGRAQARAAREAATIAAEAQREAALWTVRQVQVAELLRSVNRLYGKCSQLWIAESEELADEIGELSEEMSLQWHEVRLVVTRKVADEAGKLVSATTNFEVMTQQYARVLHARRALAQHTLDGDERGPEIIRILESSEEGDRDPSVAAFRSLVPELSDEQIRYLLVNHGESDDYIRHLRANAKREYRRSLIATVHESRTMLRAEEKAPVRLMRRRFWRWRPVTPTSARQTSSA